MAAPPGHGRGGWNPRFGWDDDGGPPPGQQGYIHGGFGGLGAAYAAGYGAAAPMMGAGPYGHPGGFPPMGMPQGQAPYYAWPQFGQPGVVNSYDPSQRFPQPHPRVSSDVPGLNMVNSTGGAGCEPGYNYIFHGEHTKLHVFRTVEPPWRAPGMHYSFAKFQVPTNTTIAELMARFGAFNPNPRLNRITEVIEGGGGHWYRGMVFEGDQEGDISQTLKDVGWDGSRTGREKGVVWLWVTKD
ncbi:hypothetical protein SAMD00023353_5500550 [Rosellinia necatrix]|uniref:Uncharacterized protein n=1 Tax=Rosellinia necatrix TaxID=77044 RepID=A0A1W2TQW9_ROSNE|nr:hypothetical protein SAMD00023353_5500550 [Rosellinia necatrix]